MSKQSLRVSYESFKFHTDCRSEPIHRNAHQKCHSETRIQASDVPFRVLFNVYTKSVIQRLIRKHQRVTQSVFIQSLQTHVKCIIQNLTQKHQKPHPGCYSVPTEKNTHTKKCRAFSLSKRNVKSGIPVLTRCSCTCS